MKREALALSAGIMLAIPACSAGGDQSAEPEAEVASTIPEVEPFESVTEDKAYELWGDALHQFVEEFHEGKATLGVGRGVCMYWENGTGYTVVKNPVVYSMQMVNGTMNFFPFLIPNEERGVAIKNGPFDFYGVDAAGNEDVSHSWVMEDLYSFTGSVTFEQETGFGEVDATEDLERAWFKGTGGERLAETILVATQTDLEEVLQKECTFAPVDQNSIVKESA